jgi:hypothetical protein
MRVPAWMRLGVALLLLGFELSMLVVGFFGARVSPAYREYFIEQRTGLWTGETVQDAGRISR